MTLSQFLLKLTFAATAWAAATVAYGNVVSGELWHVPDAVARNAIPANVPGTSPDVTFDVNSPLNFGTGITETVQAFLSSGGAFNIVENTPGALASIISNGVISTIISFSGVVSVTNGEQFTVNQDDGLTLIIGSVNLGFDPGPGVNFFTATYHGPSGTFPFQLVYGECCDGSAALTVGLPLSNVPEPSTLAILGFGLLSVGAACLKRFG